MLGLTACTDTNHHPLAESSPTATSGSSAATQPPPRSAPQPPTSRTATLSVSSATLTVGQPITVSGTDCPAGSWASASVLPSVSNEGPAIFDTYLSTGGGGIEMLLEETGSATRVASSPNGTWVIDANVPMVFPGPSVISASCRPADLGESVSAGFLYRPMQVSVTTPDALSVTPGTTVTPGSTLTVQPEGGNCPGPAVTPIVALYDERGTTQVLASTMGEPHPGTYWQASLVVPLQAKAGRYQLEADCDYSRGAIYGSYAPVEITVR
jgi:hypothetical protein